MHAKEEKHLKNKADSIENVEKLNTINTLIENTTVTNPERHDTATIASFDRKGD